MKAAKSNPHPKPKRNPDYLFHCNDTVISAFYGLHNVEIYQDRDGHTQRLQLSFERWENFKRQFNTSVA